MPGLSSLLLSPSSTRASKSSRLIRRRLSQVPLLRAAAQPYLVLFMRVYEPPQHPHFNNPENRYLARWLPFSGLVLFGLSSRAVSIVWRMLPCRVLTRVQRFSSIIRRSGTALGVHTLDVKFNYRGEDVVKSLDLACTQIGYPKIIPKVLRPMRGIIG